VVDPETGDELEIRARLIASATGPFTDGFLSGARRRLRPTLGVHLVFDAGRVPHGGRAIVLRSPRDNRLFFVLPAGPRTVVGTTDTDFAPAENPGRPPRVGDEIRARGSDVAYLIEALRHAFPSLALRPADVLSTYAGLRPLLAANAQSPSETSREHEISRGPDGVLIIAGGKLTTNRRMAEEAVNRVSEELRATGLERPLDDCSTATRSLPGGGPPPAALGAHEFGSDVAARIAGAYGARAGELLAIVSETPALAARLDPELGFIWAEVVHAVRRERARDLADVFTRRVPIFRDARTQGLTLAARAAALIGAELGWNGPRQTREIEKYRATVAHSRRWQTEI
jgi:glycerol-3-phosphate dehydrogenase